MEVRPFIIHIPDDILDDLRRRLGQTRFPDEIPGSGWDYGSNLEYLKALVHYWRTDFDWRAQEEKLNRLHHYKTPVHGLNIHFIHERGIGPNPMPLVMTHGWPSCFFEMTKILPFLTDPGRHGGDPVDAFDMVVPSLPGFGFSDHATERGMDVQWVAGLWNTLMTDNLGYPRFAAQGGDIGAGVTAWLGYAHADNLYGIHLTSITRPTPYLGPDAKPITAAEQALIDQRARWQQAEGGYAHMQGTKPQTLAYGLNDSPAGLAAWIVEKYRTWSDCHGDVEARYTKDELLTIITIYWVTQTISSSTRMYLENQRKLWVMDKDDKVPAPAGMAMFPQEIARPSREWDERAYNRRCFRGVGLLCSLGVRESEHPSPQASDVMIMQVLHCPHCQGTDIIRHGTTRQGKQRYRCQEHACQGRTFLLEYTYAGHAAGVKQQIIDMAMNASGIRDTARVLHVSPTTVIKELKKKSRSCSRCIMRCWRS